MAKTPSKGSSGPRGIDRCIKESDFITALGLFQTLKSGATTNQIARDFVAAIAGQLHERRITVEVSDQHVTAIIRHLWEKLGEKDILHLFDALSEMKRKQLRTLFDLALEQHRRRCAEGDDTAPGK